MQHEAAFAEALRHYRAGRPRDAADAARAALQHAPNHAGALQLLGVLAAEAGKLAEARDLLERAIRVKPADADLRFNAGLVALAAGDEDQALERFEQATACAPEHYGAALNRGDLLLRRDRLEEAARSFRSAAALRPQSAEPLLGLGNALRGLKQTDAALASYRQAVALAPRNAEAIGNLGGLLLERDPAAACDYLRQAVALAPDLAPIRVAYGVALHQSGAPAAALEQYREALLRDPGNTRALGALAVALAAAGRTAEAAALCGHRRLIVAQPLPVPPGYGSMTAFNAALAEAVSSHPSLEQDRPGKTTRGGSQTGELLHRPRGAIASLAILLQQRVADYLASVSLPAGHPFLARRPAAWHLRGWATVLGSGGHQDPHNHPSGILSGVYYVRVPAPIGSTEAGDAGWIEFGRPSARFGVSPAIDPVAIRPEEGLALVFPSYLWHNTVPFTATEPRISIAFDVVPAPG